MRILLIRLSSIGDILCITPIIRCIHEQLGAEIHVICKPAFRELLESHPYVTELIKYSKDHEHLSTLKNHNYDWVIDLHKNWRSQQIIRQLDTRSITFYKLNLRKWLLTTFHWNTLPKKHLIDRYFEALAPLSVHPDGKGMEIFIPDEKKQKVHHWLQKMNLQPKKYGTLVLGGAHGTKQMPANLIEKMIPELHGQIVLIGGEKENSLAESLQQKFPKKIFNACGSFTLLESAACIQSATYIITPDTGMMHIAAAVCTPLLVIWGNTTPDFGMYPYIADTQLPVNSFEVSNLFCRPCSKLGYDKCPKGHFHCMMQQDTKAITTKANLYLHSS